MELHVFLKEGGRVGGADFTYKHTEKGCEDGVERNLKMLTLKTVMIQLQAKEGWHSLEAGRSKKQILS